MPRESTGLSLDFRRRFRGYKNDLPLVFAGDGIARAENPHQALRAIAEAATKSVLDSDGLCSKYFVADFDSLVSVARISLSGAST
jgi:hypothetical protein